LIDFYILFPNDMGANSGCGYGPRRRAARNIFALFGECKVCRVRRVDRIKEDCKCSRSVIFI
jgi:hypothetical protein